ncbi:PorP/SprF family type IX secretion system membrane protein [uncultured Sunxiuqinia sp.]|uniref:PorP/SprF family type IX secretion system membrane protein n=1 Tax=uncultured Sunxiuqinia sp. TaxID=1573825 RepID=UPI002AA70DA6|nr:PorP/SprF family type IX secretion system membrane protein [uncultured Sunxiuqinia sp.]
MTGRRKQHIITNCIKRNFVLFMMVMAFHVSAQAQTDPIFTQYMNSIQTVNPAYAGMWEKVGVQVFTRQYYVGHSGAPLTKSVSFYSPVKNENNGIGLNIVDDRIGYEKKLTVTADYAYQVRLDWKTYLRMGLKAGFINYDNLLTQYQLYPDGIDDPQFMEDVHINFMVSWGIGAMVYSKDYYVSFSIPQIIQNDFQANRNNYSSLAELRYAYLIGGYIFGQQRQIRFKPSFMLKGAIGAPIQADVSANFLFYNKFWLGAMYRTNNTVAAVMQLVVLKNLRLGYAVDYSISQEFRKYQLGTHEIRLIYEYDFYKRPYTKRRYF